MIKAHQYYFFFFQFVVEKKQKTETTTQSKGIRSSLDFFFGEILIGPSYEHIILTVSKVESEILRWNFSSVLRVSEAVLSEEFVAWPEL